MWAIVLVSRIHNHLFLQMPGQPAMFDSHLHQVCDGKWICVAYGQGFVVMSLLKSRFQPGDKAVFINPNSPEEEQPFDDYHCCYYR